jgi:hypothetical protein
MRVNLEIQPGQETRGDKLTISEVLAEYLRAEKSRLATENPCSIHRSDRVVHT